MFADNAFLKPDLTDGLTLENIYQLDIRPGCNVLELPLNPEMADMYVFRQCTPTPTGLTVTNDRLPYSTLKPHMKDMGGIAGFREVARPYCLRYVSGKAFDKDGTNRTAII
jgi:hypothetical protein